MILQPLAAWLAFVAGVLIQEGPGDFAALASAGAIGAVFVLVGYAAASRTRTLARVQPPLRLAAWAAVIGAAMGTANLFANWLIAEMDPALRAVLVQRFAAIDPVDAVVAAPLVEETTVRLFLMSAIAWLVWVITRRRPVVFAIALFGSSIIFASLHLARPFPIEPALANQYRAALLVKYTLAGLPLGWMFWRWGLPYAILGHAAANAAHIALEGIVF